MYVEPIWPSMTGPFILFPLITMIILYFSILLTGTSVWVRVYYVECPGCPVRYKDRHLQGAAEEECQEAGPGLRVLVCKYILPIMLVHSQLPADWSKLMRYTF